MPHLGNDILKTTESALDAHHAEWAEKLRASVSPLSEEDAAQLGVPTTSASKVNLTNDDIEHLISALEEIEHEFGKYAIFSQLPLRVASAAWRELLGANIPKTDFE